MLRTLASKQVMFTTLWQQRGKALSVAEIAKEAKISVEEAYLGIGWLFKEGKVKDDNNNIVLA